MTQSNQTPNEEKAKQDPLRYGGPVELITTPLIWWSGLGFLLVFGVLVWAILGRIPVIASGKGAFSFRFEFSQFQCQLQMLMRGWIEYLSNQVI